MGSVIVEDTDVPEAIRSLMSQSLVWDNHGCMPLRHNDDSFLPQLDRYARSGVDIVSLNVGFDGVTWENTVLVLAHFRAWIQCHSERFMLISRVADIEFARRTGRLGICFDIEGGSALNETLGMIDLYYKLGVRWMLIAYNRNNPLGGGCQDDDTGLTRFGRKVLDEMARVGMVACCSHTGLRTTMDVFEYSPNPVIFSHSNPASLWNHPRNITDDTIKACAGTGGVVGINGIGMFLGNNDNRTETIVRHIDHVVQLVGPEYVGIGLDYVFDKAELIDYLRNKPERFPPEFGYGDGYRMVQPEQIPEIAQALLNLGYTDSDLRLILGENHLRIAGQVWQ